MQKSLYVLAVLYCVVGSAALVFMVAERCVEDATEKKRSTTVQPGNKNENGRDKAGPEQNLVSKINLNLDAGEGSSSMGEKEETKECKPAEKKNERKASRLDKLVGGLVFVSIFVFPTIVQLAVVMFDCIPVGIDKDET